MDENTLRDRIRRYLLDELIRDAGYPLTDKEPIITTGLMDSFALAELAVYIESNFGIYLPDTDLTVEKMNSIDQIVMQIRLKQSES